MKKHSIVRDSFANGKNIIQVITDLVIISSEDNFENRIKHKISISPSPMFSLICSTGSAVGCFVDGVNVSVLRSA